MMSTSGSQHAERVFIDLDSDKDEDDHESFETEAGNAYDTAIVLSPEHEPKMIMTPDKAKGNSPINLRCNAGVSKPNSGHKGKASEYTENREKKRSKGKRTFSMDDDFEWVPTGFSNKYQREKSGISGISKKINGGWAAKDKDNDVVERKIDSKTGLQMDCLNTRGDGKRVRFVNEVNCNRSRYTTVAKKVREHGTTSKSLEIERQRLHEDVQIQAESKGAVQPKNIKKPTAWVETKRKEGKRYVRTCTRYIHKKFSPIILSDIIAGLSVPQREWVMKTGFSGLLDFKMEKYPHALGYNVVEAFDRATCTLRLKSGSIKISENVVKKVLGLPNGGKKINLVEREGVVLYWGKQFPSRHVYNITPNMVYQKLQGTVHLTKLFKLNFLVLMSNYLIESNHGGYMSRDILGYMGNLDACYEYNWCELLIRKLLSAHEYWSLEPNTRTFSGSLPFLIYLYVDRVISNETSYVERMEPAYKTWTDDMLRDRQRLDAKNDAFGVGILLQFPEEDNTNVQFRTTTSATENNVGDDNTKIDESLFVEDSYDGDALGTDVGHDEDNGLQAMGEEEGKQGHADIYHGDDFGNVEQMVYSRRDVKNNADVQVRLTHDEVETEQMGILSDAELDASLGEETLIASFAESVRELNDAYKRCINIHEIASALYPENPNITELKQRIIDIFGVDGDVSPLAKHTASVSKANVVTPLDSQPSWPTQVSGEIDNVSAELLKTSHGHNEIDDAPSFSLGLTQAEPRNLNYAIGGNH